MSKKSTLAGCAPPRRFSVAASRCPSTEKDTANKDDNVVCCARRCRLDDGAYGAGHRHDATGRRLRLGPALRQHECYYQALGLGDARTTSLRLRTCRLATMEAATRCLAPRCPGSRRRPASWLRKGAGPYDGVAAAGWMPTSCPGSS